MADRNGIRWPACRSKRLIKATGRPATARMRAPATFRPAYGPRSSPAPHRANAADHHRVLETWQLLTSRHCQRWTISAALAERRSFVQKQASDLPLFPCWSGPHLLHSRVLVAGSAAALGSGQRRDQMYLRPRAYNVVRQCRVWSVIASI